MIFGTHSSDNAPILICKTHDMEDDMRILNAIFTEHPASVSESYFEHLRFALSFSGLLAYAAFAAFIHALVPCLFEKTAGNIIRQLAVKIERR